MKSRITFEVEPEMKKNIRRRTVELGKTTVEYILELIVKDLKSAKPVTIFADKNNIRIKNV